MQKAQKNEKTGTRTWLFAIYNLQVAFSL